MDVRRIRPLFLPPHPRRNRYAPMGAGRTARPAEERENCMLKALITP